MSSMKDFSNQFRPLLISRAEGNMLKNKGRQPICYHSVRKVAEAIFAEDKSAFSSGCPRASPIILFAEDVAVLGGPGSCVHRLV